MSNDLTPDEEWEKRGHVSYVENGVLTPDVFVRTLTDKTCAECVVLVGCDLGDGGPLHEATVGDLAQQLLACREALRDLLAEQNGPPLIRKRKEWEAAVRDARACLPEHQA